MRSEEGIHPIENQVNPNGIAAGRIAIVAAEWNSEIVAKLISGAESAIAACENERISSQLIRVPGSFEIPLASKFICEAASREPLNSTSAPLIGVVALGCLIRGETEHFQLISNEVSRSLSALSLQLMIPIGLGVICAYSKSDAEERAGGLKGNYGEEAADAVIRMSALRNSLFSSISGEKEGLDKIRAQA